MKLYEELDIIINPENLSNIDKEECRFNHKQGVLIQRGQEESTLDYDVSVCWKCDDRSS